MTKAEIVKYLKNSITDFEKDPPDTNYQEGYLAAHLALLPQANDVGVQGFIEILEGLIPRYEDFTSKYDEGFYDSVVETLRVTMGYYDRRETLEQLLKRAAGHALH